jgi:hypothetical protein
MALGKLALSGQIEDPEELAIMRVFAGCRYELQYATLARW